MRIRRTQCTGRREKRTAGFGSKMADVPDIDLYADDIGDDFHGVSSISRVKVYFKVVDNVLFHI